MGKSETSEVKLARKRIKPGREEQIREWYEELRERESEVIETLRHEGVYTESAFVLSGNEATYLYVYMEASDLQEALEAGDQEVYDIDEEHHAVLENSLTGEWEDFEIIGHFTNPERS